MSLDEKMNEKFVVPTGYRIPEEDEAKLRTILGVPVRGDEKPDPLPDIVVACYYAAKRGHDLMGVMVTEQSLALIVATTVMLSQPGIAARPVELAPERDKNFLDTIRERHVKQGALVIAKWRDKEVPGHFCGMLRGDMLVLIDGNERAIAPEDVRLPDKDEWPDLPRNLNG